MICKYILLIFLNEPELIFWHPVKDFEVYLIQITLFTINHLFTHSKMVSSCANTLNLCLYTVQMPNSSF